MGLKWSSCPLWQYPLCKRGPPSPPFPLPRKVDWLLPFYLSVGGMVALTGHAFQPETRTFCWWQVLRSMKLQGKLKRFPYSSTSDDFKSQYSELSIVSREILYKAQFLLNTESRREAVLTQSLTFLRGLLATDPLRSLISKPWDLRGSQLNLAYIFLGLGYQVVLSAAILTMESSLITWTTALTDTK